MRREMWVLAVGIMGLLFGLSFAASASEAVLFFTVDKNGTQPVTVIDEGDEIFIAVLDPDENTDCDVRDKIWTDIKIMDPKTGAYIVWKSYRTELGDGNGHLLNEESYVPYAGHWPGETAGWLGGDYLEETGADTGLFVSKRAFRVGTRASFQSGIPHAFTHVVDAMTTREVTDFQWGGYSCADTTEFSPWFPFENDYADNRGVFVGSGVGTNPGFEWSAFEVLGLEPVLPLEEMIGENEYLLGRFENMNTLVGFYQDPNDPGDVAISMMKISDTEAALSWDRSVYPDANEAATLTIVDPDENLDCSQVECVPVFILVNPGSWNPVIKNSPNTFCMLLATGGVDGRAHNDADAADVRIRWFNIYNAHANAMPPIANGAEDGRYYVEYPTAQDANVVAYDTAHRGGVTPVSFYAWETGSDTGVFQLNLNSILEDLGFESLNVRDMLAAYYLDPNDFDDFKVATAVIEEDVRSSIRFTDAQRADQDLYWLGRDSVYVEVVDANANTNPCSPEQVLVHLCDPHGEDDTEWLILDETSANSPVFASRQGHELLPVWNAAGIGLVDSVGGWQLRLDNWRIEAFNEDDIIVRYNDAVYTRWTFEAVGTGAFGDGPVPLIEQVRVAGDVAFDTMSIADTQVFDGQTTTMRFLDREGNPVAQYSPSDCAFIEVTDPDQNEEIHRREKISAGWDVGQNTPFGPLPFQDFDDGENHPFSPNLGEIDIFAAATGYGEELMPQIYILNPRARRWASVDLLETERSSGTFVSTICVDLASANPDLPVLDAQPGDTLIAVYRDPSNHSDSAWISIRVGPADGSPQEDLWFGFVDAGNQEIAQAARDETVWFQVIDPSLAGRSRLDGALTLEGAWLDLTLVPGETFVFNSPPIVLSGFPQDEVVAYYTPPGSSWVTGCVILDILQPDLVIDSFYVAPNPVQATAVFTYHGSGLAERMAVTVYSLHGEVLGRFEAADTNEVVWDAVDVDGYPLANGAYIFAIEAEADGAQFADTGTFIVHRTED